MNVLRFAQKVDQSAQRFYEEMATRTDNPGIEKIFRMLANDEAMLLSRHKALARTGASADIAALDGEANVFEQLRHREDQLAVPDDLAAYRLALEAEREVLQQYRDVAQVEVHPEVRRLLDNLARDEQLHVEALEGLYDFTNAPNHYLAWGEFSNLGEFHNFGRDGDLLR